MIATDAVYFQRSQVQEGSCAGEKPLWHVFVRKSELAVRTIFVLFVAKQTNPFAHQSIARLPRAHLVSKTELCSNGILRAKLLLMRSAHSGCHSVEHSYSLFFLFRLPTTTSVHTLHDYGYTTVYVHLIILYRCSVRRLLPSFAVSFLSFFRFVSLFFYIRFAFDVSFASFHQPSATSSWSWCGCMIRMVSFIAVCHCKAHIFCSHWLYSLLCGQLQILVYARARVRWLTRARSHPFCFINEVWLFASLEICMEARARAHT